MRGASRASALAFAGLVLVAAGCGERKTRTFEVSSSSMEPTIHCARPAPGCSAARDDKVVVAHLHGVHRGEIVLLRAPERAALVCGGGGFYVKRVIALPGDTWSERAGFIWVDGKKLREPYVKRPRDDRTYATRRVPPHAYIVLGDNRALSCDSRVWGPLPAKDVLARVIKIVRHAGG